MLVFMGPKTKMALKEVRFCKISRFQLIIPWIPSFLRHGGSIYYGTIRYGTLKTAFKTCERTSNMRPRQLVSSPTPSEKMLSISGQLKQPCIIYCRWHLGWNSFFIIKVKYRSIQTPPPLCHSRYWETGGYIPSMDVPYGTRYNTGTKSCWKWLPWGTSPSKKISVIGWMDWSTMLTVFPGYDNHCTQR